MVRWSFLGVLLTLQNNHLTVRSTLSLSSAFSGALSSALFSALCVVDSIMMVAGMAILGEVREGEYRAGTLEGDQAPSEGRA